MQPRLPNNFLHEDCAWQRLFGVFLLPGGLLLGGWLLRGLLVSSGCFSLLENIEGETLALLQDLIDEVLVAICGFEEVDYLLSVVVNVGTVVIRVLNRLLWGD